MKNARTAAENVRYWKSRVEEHRKSGLSQKEYCRQEGISYWSFSSWKRKVGTESDKLTGIPTSLVHSLSLRNKETIELIPEYGIRISIPDGFSEETLKRILSLLGTAK